MLVQLVANAIVIGLVILLLPGFELHARREVLAVLWLAVLFGVLSALVRPGLEFLLLPYLLQSLGLVVVLIDAALLALLSLTRALEIDGVGWLFLGAVAAGVVGFVLDNVLGLTPPVVDESSARRARGERAVRLAALSERLRLMQVYGVLVQYVVDLAFDRAWLRPVRRRMQEWLWRPPVPVVPLPPEVKVRLLLEELGPTYVKLGQIVSSQGRALPPAWEQELARLQNTVRPFAYEDVCTIVTGAFDAPLERLYASFDPMPLAAASLAQVHEATTLDGRQVAVKVQRPNIHEQLRSDVTILTRGARVLERRVQWAEDADLAGVVHEFGTTLMRELDYTIEAYNAHRLARVLAPIEGVHVPFVEAELSSERVLTLEFIDGVKATDTLAIDAAGLDRQTLARNFVQAAVQMVMISGFFHADPHPGNVLVELANGRVTLLDTGMVGVLDAGKRLNIVRFLLAFRDRDVSGLATTLLSFSQPFRAADESGYRTQFEQRVGPLIDTPTGRSAPVQKLVTEAVDVLRSSGYRLDPQLTLAVKSVAQAEAIATTLLPDADPSRFAELAGEALKELAPHAVSSTTVFEEARRQALSAAGELAQRLPSLQQSAEAWLEQLQQGELPIRVRLANPDPPSELAAVPRLIATAIVLTGVLIASALGAGLITGTSTFRSTVADVALAVYLAALAVGVVALVALLRRLVRPERRPRHR